MVPGAPSGRRVFVGGTLCSGEHRGGMACHRGHVWLLWGRGWSAGTWVAAVWAWPILSASSLCCWGVACSQGPGWGPWRRYQSNVTCLFTMGAWLGNWAPGGSRGVVESRWGHALPPLVRGRYPGPLVAAVGMWSVAWDPYGCCGGVAGLLLPGWLPCGRG